MYLLNSSPPSGLPASIQGRQQAVGSRQGAVGSRQGAGGSRQGVKTRDGQKTENKK